MKMNKILKILAAFAMAAVLVTGGLTGFTTAKAAEITAEEDVMLPEAEAGVARTATVIGFDVSGLTNRGRFVASKNPISVSFGGCSVGAAHIKIHKNSYSGSVVGSFIMNYGPIPTQTMSIPVTAGSTYYITVEPYSDYIQAVGSFEISY